jgi:hypothetical protein
MAAVSFDSCDRVPAVKTVGHRPFSIRGALRTWWRGLPSALRDGLIIAVVLAGLFAFSSLLRHLLG